jgi:YegS/Rv2252/BmrU family lipid kinase
MELGSEARRYLERRGLEVVQRSLPDPSAVGELIREEQPGLDRVIAAGGDGTLNSVLQGLMGTGLPLAVIPLGTANNLARTLDIPASLEEACEVAAGASTRRIDLGWVNGRYFFTTASMGLSVQITESLTHQIKRRWGALAYAVAAFRALTRARLFRAEIVWSGGRRDSRTIQVVVGNGRYYGSALPVAADATIDDARLDLYSVEIRHWWELIGLVPALRRGRQGEKESVEAIRATEFEITTRVPMEINVDGEICSRTPARFRVLPSALEVFVPRSRR